MSLCTPICPQLFACHATHVPLLRTALTSITLRSLQRRKPPHLAPTALVVRRGIMCVLVDSLDLAGRSCVVADNLDVVGQCSQRRDVVARLVTVRVCTPCAGVFVHVAHHDAELRQHAVFIVVVDKPRTCCCNAGA